MIDCLLLIVLLFQIFNKSTENKLKIERNKIEVLKLDIDIEKTDALLDQLVNSALDEYMAFNPQIQNEVYINSTLEMEIVEGVTTLAVDRISNVLFDKIALCYATEKILDIISRRVYLRVLVFEIEHESDKRAEIENRPKFEPNPEEKKPESY